MPTFGSLVFTPVVKTLQEKYGSRKQYERIASRVPAPDRLGEDEREFIAARDSFYMSTVGSTGWPYVQHRGGPKGFLKVIDDKTLAFADYTGNKQFVSAGNLGTDDRVALILLDYPHQARLKILGHAEVLESEEWIAKLRDPAEETRVERVYLIHVEALDWNCQQHITPRFTAEELRPVLLPFERRLQELEKENEQLRERLAKTA